MKSTIKFSIAFAIVLFFNLKVDAQVKMGNNPTTLNANAELELESTNRGLLLPRLALSATTNFAPLTAHIAGMTVYNTATAGDVVPAYYYNDGTKWVQIATSSDFWTLKGNSGTTPPTAVGTAVGINNFWGTKDAQNLAVGVNGTTRMIFDQKGNAWGGGTGNVMSSDSSSLIWGSNNKLFSYNSMVVGYANVDSSRYSVVFGNGNILGSGLGAIGGNNRTNRGTILGGGDNQVIGGENYNSMINGSLNLVSGTCFESIITGFKNAVTSSQKVLVGGQENSVVSSNFGTTHGKFNSVKSGYSIVQGTANSLDLLSENSAIFGNDNKLYGYSSLVAGLNNIDSSSRSFVFGWGNTLGAGGGQTNRGTILGGSGNSVTGGSNYNSIINGSQVTVRGTCFESIITGYLTTVTNSQKVVVSGQGHTVTNATGSAVFGNFSTVSAGSTLVSGAANNVNAGADYGIALGQSNTVAANHPNSMAIGKGVITTASAQYVSGFAGGYKLYSDAGNTIGVQVAAGGTSWASISDKRSKDNIKNINYGLATLMQLRPAMYNYKGQKNTSLGFIAQEVKEIMPEVVEQTTMGPNHDYLGIKYTEMIPVITKAIQELKTENDALKAKNQDAEKELASLKSQMESLSSLSAQVKELQALIGMKKSDSENSMKASKK